MSFNPVLCVWQQGCCWHPSVSGEWNQQQGLVSGWVAAPAIFVSNFSRDFLVAVQSDSGSAGSVAVVADEFCAWLCWYWCCPQPSALSHPNAPLSSPYTPESLDRRSPVTGLQRQLPKPAGLIFPVLRSRLQTSLKWSVGLPAVRVPVASSQGVCP